MEVEVEIEEDVDDGTWGRAGGREAFDSSFALVRLFTEDPDRRWLAWNEGVRLRRGVAKGPRAGGAVTEKYEGWARAAKGEARELGRRNEPS